MSNQREGIALINQPPRDMRFHPRTFTINQVIRQREETISLQHEHATDAAADGINQFHFHHRVGQARVAISFWRHILLATSKSPFWGASIKYPTNTQPLGSLGVISIMNGAG